MKLKIICISIFILTASVSYSQDWKTYPYHPSGSLISFSADEGRHAAEPIEWWYTSGHLEGVSSGKSYSYMLTYFYYPASIFQGFRILNITDDETGTFHQDMQPLNYTNLSTTKLNIEANLFFGGTETWRNKLDGTNAPIPFVYAINAFASFGNLNLEYETLKRPLIVGDDGYLEQGSENYTFYYSQTKNDVSGSLILNGMTENVIGTAWIDRQYGNFNPLNGEQYEWFAIQLSNGMDINLWPIFTTDRTIPDNERYRILASYVDENTQYTSSDFQIERLEFNWMPDNLRCYAKRWRLTSTVNNLDLRITTLHDNTEVQLPFRFFEGATTVSGSVNGVAVNGLGFAELLHAYEHPEMTFLVPKDGFYDVTAPITWQLENPDDGRPIFYDLSYSIDSQQNFLPIAQGLTDTSYLWNGLGLSAEDEIWFKVRAYSVDGILNNILISPSSSTPTLSSGEINDLGISIYPNPVEDTLILKLPETIGRCSVQVMDINGKVIKTFEWGDFSNGLNVKFLNSGLYFVSIISDKGKSTIKFIKN